jgi:hypothetical protein
LSHLQEVSSKNKAKIFRSFKIDANFPQRITVGKIEDISKEKSECSPRGHSRHDLCLCERVPSQIAQEQRGSTMPRTCFFGVITCDQHDSQGLPIDLNSERNSLVLFWREYSPGSKTSKFIARFRDSEVRGQVQTGREVRCSFST